MQKIWDDSTTKAVEPTERNGKHVDNVIPTQDQWQYKMYHCTVSHPLENTLQVATDGSYK